MGYGRYKNYGHGLCDLDLGDMLESDNALQYTKHIDDVCRSLSSKVALLKRIKQFLPLHYRKMYFNAYILPSIDYCLTIWGNAPKCHLDRILIKFQKYAARIILDAPPDSPSEPLFKKLGWLNIYERIQYNKAILLYKVKTPGYILVKISKLPLDFVNRKSCCSQLYRIIISLTYTTVFDKPQYMHFLTNSTQNPVLINMIR